MSAKRKLRKELIGPLDSREEVYDKVIMCNAQMSHK